MENKNYPQEYYRGISNSDFISFLLKLGTFKSLSLFLAAKYSFSINNGVLSLIN